MTRISRPSNRGESEQFDTSLARRDGLPFWARWVLATVFGFAGGGLVGGSYGMWRGLAECKSPVIEYPSICLGSKIYTYFILFGFFVNGILQALVVQRFFRADRQLDAKWISATLVGAILGYGVVSAGGLVLLRVLDLSLEKFDYLILGSVVGIAQWLILRHWISLAGWWVAISAVSWAVALGVVPVPKLLYLLTREGDLYATSALSVVARAGLGGTLAGAAAGIVAGRLLA